METGSKVGTGTTGFNRIRKTVRLFREIFFVHILTRVISAPPAYVRITGHQVTMSVGREYRVECLTGGSNPPATITWLDADRRPFTHNLEQVYANTDLKNSSNV
jgi:hypothetical protein